MFNDRLKKVREKANLTVKQAASALRLPYTTYNNYEKNMREPSGGVLCRIAEFYGVSTDYLLGLEEKCESSNKSSDNNSIKEKSEILKKINSLDEYGKKLVNFVIDSEYERCMECAEKHQESLLQPEPEEKIKMITVKSSEYKVSAGTGFLLGEGDADTEVEVPDTLLARKADFALCISGNSMEPIYHDGDVVLVKRQNFVSTGEIGIFVVDGSGYIKKFGGDRLISLNNEYKDIILNENTYVHCCGKVIGRA